MSPGSSSHCLRRQVKLRGKLAVGLVLLEMCKFSTQAAILKQTVERSQQDPLSLSAIVLLLFRIIPQAGRWH